jgi:serine/threonine protein kinase
MSTCATCGTPYLSDLCPKCLAGFAQNPLPDDPVPSPGGSLAGCEVLELLGQGAMGVVFKVRDPLDGRFYAIKILAPDYAEDPWIRRRLAREGRALMGLSHPNIVRVHSMGVDLAAAILQQAKPGERMEIQRHTGDRGGAFSIRMEFVDGANLRKEMAAGPIGPRAAAELMIQVCRGLQFAHDRGVIHRDIKPENLLVDRAGTLKIADFGLAKILPPPRAPAAPAAGGPAKADDWSPRGSQAALSTAQSDFLGTPSYMAPEQSLNPRDVDARADLYSAGIVFFELLSGRRPPGPPLGAPLDRIVSKMLEPDRRHRYATAAAIGADLAAVRPSL